MGSPTSTIFSLKFLSLDCLTLSPGWRCGLGMEQWGSCIWSNEFQLEWTKNKCKLVNILWNGDDYLMDGLCSSFFLFSYFGRILLWWIVCAGLCSRPQGCPRQRHTGAERVHLWWKSHGKHHLWPFLYMKEKLNDKQTSQTLFLSTGNQDEWCSLSGLWDMDMDRNVRGLKRLVNACQICFWFSYIYNFQNTRIPHSSG